MGYVTGDRCLHKVFNDLRARNPEPVDFPDPHEHHHSGSHQDNSLDDTKFEPMLPVIDGPTVNEMAGCITCFEEHLKATVNRL